MPQQGNYTSDGTRNQLPSSGFSYVNRILDNVDAEELIALLLERRRNGRPGYHPRSMIRAWLCKYILADRYRYMTDFLEGLRRSKAMRRVCGFDDDVPTEGAMSQFNKRLKEYQDLADRCLFQVNEQLREFWSDLGRVVAIDSTSIETYSNPNRSKTFTDPNANWGVKHSARTKQDEKSGKDDEKTEWFFGYKLHVISDVKYEIPLGAILTPANQNDSTMLKKLFKQVKATYKWFKPKYLLADRGYDSEPNHRYLIKQGVTPIIHIRKPTADDGMYDGIYTKEGVPTCMGMKPMVYVKTDPDTGEHLYRCRGEGCHLLTEGTKATTHCDTEEWYSPEANPRVLGPLPRESEEWKALYKKRMSIERIFKNLKQSRLLEGHLFRDMGKIQLLATWSMLTYNLTKLANLQVGAKNPHKIKVRLAA